MGQSQVRKANLIFFGLRVGYSFGDLWRAVSGGSQCVSVVVVESDQFVKILIFLVCVCVFVVSRWSSRTLLGS